MPKLKDVLPEATEAPSPSYPTAGQARLLWTALAALALLTLLSVAGLVFMGLISFLSWAYPVLLPIGLAVIIALVLEPGVNFLEKRGVRRRTGTLGVCLLALVAFLLFWIFLVPTLVDYGGEFIRTLPGLINESVAKLEHVAEAPTAPLPEVANLVGHPLVPATNQVAIAAPPVKAPPVKASPVRASRVRERRPVPPPVNNSEMQDWVKTNLPLIQSSIESNVAHVVYTSVGPVGQALGFLLGFGFVPIYVYYFLADQDAIARNWPRYVPLRQSSLRNEVVSVLSEINEVLVRYFRGQIIVAACNGVLTSVGLVLILGIPNGLILGLLTGALSIVPFLGIIASILPALLLAFLSSQGWIKPVLVLAVFALVQMSESMFITPRVQSHSTGLHPLTIIIGILFWSMLLPGLLGPIVAVPLTCAVVVLLRRYVWQRRAA